jgi:hypothetical protein
MQDQPIDERRSDPIGDEPERLVLYLLLEGDGPPLWSVQELGREIGSELTAADAVVGLHASGLVHRLGEFVFATRTAARFQQLAAVA